MRGHRAGALLSLLAMALVGGALLGCSGGDPVNVAATAGDQSPTAAAPPTTEPLTAVDPVDPAASSDPTPVEVATPAPLTAATEVPSAPPVVEPTVAPAETPSPTAGSDAAESPAPTAGPAPSATPTAPTAPTIDQSDAALAANGGEVYTLSCARCHAENGLGNTDSGSYGAPLIGAGSRYSTDGLIAELTSGHPVTFGFADRLSPAEIAAVAAYVRAAFP